jgi:hypothetical protein
MPDHNYFSTLIWQIADLLRGPYRPPQYERVMLPMTVLRRFDCVLAPTKAKVLAEHERRKGGKLEGEALDAQLNKAAGQRFHNHSPLDFEPIILTGADEGQLQVIAEVVERVRVEGTGAGGSCCKKCNNCGGRKGLPSRVLQPRRYPLGRLPRQLEARHPIPQSDRR